jgi:hypothetical protein
MAALSQSTPATAVAAPARPRARQPLEDVPADGLAPRHLLPSPPRSSAGRRRSSSSTAAPASRTPAQAQRTERFLKEGEEVSDTAA